MKQYLTWPTEPASQSFTRWQQPDSNICLDFHGDPVSADLVVYSDGNHHMALAEVVEAFRRYQPDLSGIFYATTPPSVLLNIIQEGQIMLGNLVVSRQPHVFISPEFVLQKLVSLGATSDYQGFMQSVGNVLLVRADNPKSIHSIKDLLRDDVRLFLSNPETETASYEVYRNTLFAVAEQLNIEASQMQALLQRPDPSSSEPSPVVYGQRIHHREAPQTLFQGDADVAMVYYHLALRYRRIFPDHFSFVSLTGDNVESELESGNEQTTYHISALNNPGEYGELFVAFCMSDEVTHIYERHGLKRPS